LEDLNISGMLRNHRLARAIPDAAWAELARMIDYKQAWRGGRVVRVDRWFPSSKTCSSCRTIRANMPLQIRLFVCEVCRHSMDRDLNAAINLAVWAEKQQHVQIRDSKAPSPVNKVDRRDGSDPHPGGGPNRPC
jgi:putative transposase